MTSAPAQQHHEPGRAFGAQRIALFAAMAVLLAARVWFAFTLEVNSDEPQHLHIVWSWTQGVLPYRDVFDNHAPLFHILYAPLLYALGERADIVPWMRLAVIPWYALTLWLTYRLGRALYDRRIGLVAAALVALQPTFFARSVEFRPDDAWAAAWIAALVVAVSGPPTPRRAFQCGLLGSLAVAFSIKSAILIMAALVAAGLVLLVLALQQRMPHWIASVRVAAATALGGAILPTTVAIAFAAVGAWAAIRYCLIVYNTAPGLGRWSHPGWNTWAFPLLLPVLAAVIYRMLRNAADPLRPALRAWVLAIALIYLALRGSYQPLLDKQDLLPLVPMLGPVVAELLVRWGAQQELRWRIAFVAALAIEATMLLNADRPWRGDAHQYTEELGTLLDLSRPGEYVMDDKAESIFRQRPVYWILENVTLYRLAQGLIPDDIIPQLVSDRVAVGVFDRESGADSDFVRRNYVTIAPHVEVAGKLFGTVQTDASIDFDIQIPRQYAIVARSGHADGTLDGTPYTSPRELAPGSHRFIPGHGDDWALEWARAALIGYSPFAAREHPESGS